MTETKQGAKRKGGSFFGRHKKLFIFLIILVVVAVAVVLILGNLRSTAVSAAPPPQTVTLQRMDLEQIVSGTGTLKSSVKREVSSSLSYDIAEIYVQEGDVVQAGQLLAQLDTTDLDKDIAELRADIAEAKQSDALSLAQAERKLEDANNQYALDETRLNNDVADAQKTLESATADKESAKTARDNSKDALKKANKAVSNYPPEGEEGHDAAEYAALQQKAAEAQAAYDTAVQKNETLKAEVEKAQASYDAAVQQRDTTLRQDGISIENARDNVDTMKLKNSTSTYESQLEGYLEDREKCLIEAPIAGTITEMTAEVGSSAGGSAMGSTASTGTALFTIEDTNRLEITSSIPEYDAVLVQAGMSATITSDAIDGAEWAGRVKSLSPKATDDSGNFTVVVEVTDPAGELAIGMSTKLNIITDAKNGVFAVPYDAVTTNAAGESVVVVYMAGGTDGTRTPPEGFDAGNAPEGFNRENMPGDFDASNLPEGFTPQGAAGAAGAGDASGGESTSRQVKVETGMETDYYIEIQSDELQEGMQILADPESKNVSVEGAGGGFPMMGGRF